MTTFREDKSMIRELDTTGKRYLYLGKFFTSKLAPLAYVDTSNPAGLPLRLQIMLI